MNKIMSVIALLSIIVSGYVLYEVNQIATTVHPYSKENVERVRANIPLEQSTPTPAPIIKVIVPQDQVLCLQTNIYFETRNQSDLGKIGTGWVTLNRVNHPRFDNTICEVVYAASLDHRGNPIRHECQFAWYCDGMSDRPNLNNKLEREAWELSGQIAYTMVRSCILNVDIHECPPDPTNGGLFFRSGKTRLGENNYYVQTAVIEDHTYFGISE